MADNNDSFDEFLNRAEEDYDAGDIEAAEAGDEDDVLNDVEGGEDESRPGAFVSEENKARSLIDMSSIANPHGSIVEGANGGEGTIVRSAYLGKEMQTSFLEYAMSVIVSRALPEIDGFKPAHRKLLYTMYEMGLLKGARTKSANIVGSTMHLNPHGDAAIYDTMVRMGRGNESLLVPFVDSKGNFGKAYSRDMSCAAARYTEAKLEGVCEELFRDIDKETVDFVPNYDSTTTEPTLLPVTFPTILANNTLGIAVGMACNICSFNLAELCATTVALMKDEHHDISTTMPAPDFVGGGQILYDEAQMREIYENGRGSVKVRARYNVVPGENMIEVTQIPPTTTVEAIMDKIAELVKAGKVKEISDMRDETDLNGLKLTLDPQDAAWMPTS